MRKGLRSLMREPMDYRRPSLFWRATSVFVIMSQLLMMDAGMAQVSTPSIVAVTVAPSGACTAKLPLKLFVPSGVLYSCQNGTYGIAGGGGAVTSVFTRTGAVVATTGDYTAAQVTNALDLSNASTQTMSGNLALPAGSSFSANIYRDVSGSSIFTSSSGKATFGSLLTVPSLATTTNCSSAASPAVCAAAPGGSVVIAAAATTVVVNTTAVTANSQILIQPDSSLGTRLAVTCNTTLAPPLVTARTAATSFTISTAAAPTTNPACYSYTIVN